MNHGLNLSVMQVLLQRITRISSHHIEVKSMGFQACHGCITAYRLSDPGVLDALGVGQCNLPAPLGICIKMAKLYPQQRRLKLIQAAIDTLIEVFVFLVTAVIAQRADGLRLLFFCRARRRVPEPSLLRPISYELWPSP